MATNEPLSLTTTRRASPRECLVYITVFAAGLIPCAEPDLFDPHWSLAVAVGLIAMLWATRGLVLTL